MDFNKLQELKTDGLLLKKISEQDREFINEVFLDPEIRKYYIVPKEAKQDYRMLVSYWINDNSNGAGCAWIIYLKDSGIFSRDKPCGFFTFEFRDSAENARISYAIKPDFRKKGIAGKTSAFVIDTLKSLGVTSIEADIDKENIASEKVVEKLGFTTNKKIALIDPEMMREGEIRTRHLWKKNLALKTISISHTQSKRLEINAPQEEIVIAINQIVNTIKEQGEHPELVSKYFYLIGRMKYNEGNFDESKEAFGQCNMIRWNATLPDNHETFYWFARIREAKGLTEEAKMYYNTALEKYLEDPSLISKEEILRAMNK